MSAKVKWYASRVEKAVVQQMRKNVRDATMLVKRAAKENVAPKGYRSSGKNDARRIVRRSIGSRVRTFRGAIVGRVGVSRRFARTWELGGLVRSGRGKALAIPLTPAARRIGSPYDPAFDDLVKIDRPGHPPILVRRLKSGRIKPQFVLMRSVIIPPHPYLRPALDRNKGAIRRLLTRPMSETSS